MWCKRFAVCAFAGLTALSGHATELASPDGTVRVGLNLAEGELGYEVFWREQPVLLRSALGVVLQKDTYKEGWALVNESRVTHDETWSPVWGQQSSYRNHYNGLTLELMERGPAQRRMEVEFRAYNDGLAFRYRMPDAQDGAVPLSIKGEKTEFRVATDGDLWTTDFSLRKASNPNRIFSWLGHKLKGGRPWLEDNTPVTMHLDDGCYMSIHEAALVSYAPMRLRKSDDTPGRVGVHLSGPARLKARDGRYRTPWRVMLLADRPGGLIESGLLLNLNEPCAMEDTSWITTGVSTWDWRGRGAKKNDFTYGLNTESMKRYIDFSARHGLKWAMVDAGWYGAEHSAEANPLTCIDAIDVPLLANYAQSQGIGLWVYINDKALKHWGIEETLSTYKSWGVVGIKHGFLNDSTQTGVEFTEQVLEACARHQLLYDGHEPVKPTGLRRTYPHFLAREYVHSLVDGQGAASPPSYVCAVPFIHGLAGPIDRTPGMFDLDQAIERTYVRVEIPQTVAGQVAQCMAMFSGLLSLPDVPEAYEAKSDLFEYIKRLPMTWDETRILHAAIGAYLAIARRSGKEWFISCLTDEQPRTLELPLKMLDAGTYDATIYADAPDAHMMRNREAYQVSTQEVSRATVLPAVMVGGGGYSVWLRPR